MNQNLLTDLQSVGLRSTTSFRFSSLTDTNAFATFGDVDINNRGVTAYSASASGTANDAITGIYTTRNGRRTETIATQDTLQTLFQDVTSASNLSNLTFTLGREIDINNDGDVAFEGRLTFTQTESTGNQFVQIERLFIKDGNQFKTLAEEKLSQPQSSGGSGGIVVPNPFSRTIDIEDFSVNDSNQVVYRFAQFQSQARTFSLVRDGQQIAQFNTTAGSGSTVFQNPTILNNGSVYYFNTSSDLSPDVNNVFRIDSGTTTATPLISLRNQVLGFDVNEQGTVVFSGNVISESSFESQTGTYRIDGSGLTKINDTGTFLVQNNSRGSIVTQSNGNPQSIVFERNDAEQTVIATGGTINGKQVATLGLEGLNNRNQLVFTAIFSDGTRGIFRADLRRSFSSKITLSGDEIASSDGAIEVSVS